MEALDAKLGEARDRARRKQKKERSLERIEKQADSLRRSIPELRAVLDRERRDVEKLTGLSLVNLFHTMLRSKEEQLELERQQALEAALRLQEAESRSAELEREREELVQALAMLAAADLEHEALLQEKAKRLAVDCDQAAARLDQFNTAIRDKESLLVELREAILAGDAALAPLRRAEESLDKAKGWGTWDMLGGGGFSTYIKHSHVDDARTEVRRAQRALSAFQQELADVGRHSEIRIDIGGMLSFADYFFDGLIVDWVVQGKISQSLEQVTTVRKQTGAAVVRLREEAGAVEGAIAALQAEQTEWIERSR